MERVTASDRQSLSTAEVARLLGVSISSIANWTDAGELKAGRTPGGHRRVMTDDLVAFLKRQNLPIPDSLNAGNPRILIVDDEKAITQLLAEEISEAYPGFQVQVAHDGFAAGELVGWWKPNLVLLDLRMPGLDGFEVCRRIKARPQNDRPGVIGMTAYYSPQTVYDILDCGAMLCVPKPLDMKNLLLLLKAAIYGGDLDEAQRQLLSI